MKRKPPVVAIRGPVARDIVSQEDLAYLSNLQATQWRAERAAQKAALGIEARIAHGASVEVGELVFDGELKMARTRKVRLG